jgi:hypothetical protein
MANIVMNVNNKKGGKDAKGSKDVDMNSFYGKPVDMAATPDISISEPEITKPGEPSRAALAAINAVMTGASKLAVPAIDAAAAESPQTIRNPSEDTYSDNKWKRVAKKSDAKTQKGAVDETPQVVAAAVSTPTTSETPQVVVAAVAKEVSTPAASETPSTPQAAAKKPGETLRAASIREGPPPVCRLNNEEASVSDQKQMFDTMREFIATQQRAMEMMQMQLQAQAQPKQPAPPQYSGIGMPQFPGMHQFPVGFHMPMMMPSPMMHQPEWSVFGANAMPPVNPTMAQAAPTAKQHHHKQQQHIREPQQQVRETQQQVREPQQHIREPKQQVREPQQQVREPQHAKSQASKDPKADDEEVEFAPFELRLNDDCSGGFNCPNSKKPTKCPKNHHKLGDVIKKSAKLPKFFCKWERPWKKGPNGKPLRCRNLECFYAHLDGRKDFIEKVIAGAASQETAE